MRGDTRFEGSGVSTGDETMVLDWSAGPALLLGTDEGAEDGEERALDSGLLSITREWRLRRRLCVSCCCAGAKVFDLMRAFSSSHDATKASFAFRSGSQLDSHALPVSGLIPIHLIKYSRAPLRAPRLLARLSLRMHSASHNCSVSLVLELMVLAFLFAFADVELRFRLVDAITPDMREE
jgi:hypothetical protein